MTSLTAARARVRRVYYGWWVTLSGMFNMLLSSGPTFQASSVLFSAIETEFGWSRAVIAGVASFGRFGGAMFGPVEGWLTDKFGPARMVLVGFMVGGVGLILFARIHSIPAYYAAFFLLSVGFSVGGFTPSMVAVNAWMPHRRSTAMSIVIAGSSLGGFAVPLIVWGIQAHGWRSTVTVIGIITIAAGPLVAWVLAKKLPPRNELAARVRLAARKARRPEARRLGHDFTLKEALRTRAFWGIAITHMLTNFSVGALSAHIFLQLTDGNGVGLTDVAAGTVMVIWVGASFTFQLTGGYLGERLNKRLLVSGLVLVQGAALVILALADNYWMAALFAVVWGIGFGGRTPLLHAMRGEYFGRVHFGTILGMSALPMSLGMMAAPFVVGRVHDVQGTYAGALYVLAVACAMASLTILFATRPATPAKSPKAGR